MIGYHLKISQNINMKIYNLSVSLSLFDANVAMGITRTHQEYLVKQSSFKNHPDISKQNRQLDVQRMQVQQPGDEFMNDKQIDIEEIERDIEEIKRNIRDLKNNKKGLKKLKAELKSREDELVRERGNNN